MPSTNPKLTKSERPKGSADYAFRVAGHLDDHWSQWFNDLTFTHEDDGTTTLRGPVPDQAALHGLLAKIRDLGATLLSLDVVPVHGGAGPASLPRTNQVRGTRADCNQPARLDQGGNDS